MVPFWQLTSSRDSWLSLRKRTSAWPPSFCSDSVVKPALGVAEVIEITLPVQLTATVPPTNENVRIVEAGVLAGAGGAGGAGCSFSAGSFSAGSFSAGSFSAGSLSAGSFSAGSLSAASAASFSGASGRAVGAATGLSSRSDCCIAGVDANSIRKCRSLWRELATAPIALETSKAPTTTPMIEILRLKMFFITVSLCGIAFRAH
jgi:hypothetical protein